ncbi:SACS [Symbiodinium natans]|uniref:SACS protein n=1 Tax=Symbiodinium natans TaxID=878477 RepID=A0A812NBW9_9DINO|nr:SACS [Symbiodinium natans]
MASSKGAEELLKQLQAQFAAQGQSLDRDDVLNLARQLYVDGAQTDWCEAAGQSEPLTTRLKNLLKDYPADVGLFKEMVQNADDAGATRVHFVWDTRPQRKERLLSPEMKAWQTTCLWSYNDAPGDVLEEVFSFSC